MNVRQRPQRRSVMAVILLFGVVASGCGETDPERPTTERRPPTTSPDQSSSSMVRPPQGDVTIAAAGDIACDPVDDDFNGGEGTAKECHQKATAEVVERIRPDAVLALGDIQYIRGTPEKYRASYDPSWGRFKDKTYPALGNHEGGHGGTNKAYFDYFGPRAGDPYDGYYSFDVGAWHLIALNSNCGEYTFNGSKDGCAPGSAQERWLKADLALHRTACTLAFFHVPRFSSGNEVSDATNPTLAGIWQVLYDEGVDVILNGHSHGYERFAPLTPQGVVDQQSGIRQFVVGTGGEELYRFGAPRPGSEVRNGDSFGVLKLTLRQSSYDWQFVNDGSPGSTNNDSGSSACHA